MDNNKWWHIVVKDRSAQGYFPGKIPEEACDRMGCKINQCYVEEVEWNGEEFVLYNRYEQLKLFQP